MSSKKILILIAVILTLILSIHLVACIYKNNEKANIQTDRDIYTPLMSITVGIGLTSLYLLKETPENLKFYRETSQATVIL